MLQSRLLTRQSFNISNRIVDFRRRRWSSRRVATIKQAPRRIPRVRISDEFIEPPEPSLANSLRRVPGLASDISLLVLFSPFFAIWFAYRGVLRLKRAPGLPRKREQIRGTR
jgi:hypothetical protein